MAQAELAANTAAMAGEKKRLRAGPALQPWRRNFIREWRDHRGLTLEQLAERIDRSVGQVHKIETGKNAYTADTLAAIAGALGCTQADLLSRPPQAKEDEARRILGTLSEPELQHVLDLVALLRRSRQ